MSEKKILEVQMLGSITVRYDRQPVVIPRGGYSDKNAAPVPHADLRRGQGRAAQ